MEQATPSRAITAAKSNPPFPPTRRSIPASARATHELLNYLPQLSLRERIRRWDRTRKKMLMAGYDALPLELAQVG
jgi:hypothetical protein